MLRHSKKPHQCKLCNKSFGERRSFNVHMLIHKSKHNYMKSFQCKISKKSCILSQQLNKLTEGKGKGKAIDFTSPRTSSGQASRPYETVPIGTISSPSEGGRKPRGENHQALAVKGERHPTCSQESNPDCSGERQTCYHGATKPLGHRSLLVRGKFPSNILKKNIKTGEEKNCTNVTSVERNLSENIV